MSFRRKQVYYVFQAPVRQNIQPLALSVQLSQQTLILYSLHVVQCHGKVESAAIEEAEEAEKAESSSNSQTLA